MMKRTLHFCIVVAAALAVTFAVTGTAFAVTAMPGLLKYQQPDGTMIHYYLKGDENGSWKETSDGALIQQDPQNGYYYYANRLFNHTYQSNAKVGIDSKPLLCATGEDAAYLQSKSISESGHNLIQSASSGRALAGPTSVPATQPVLVLIINFANVTSTAAPGYWQDTFFLNENSSVSSYFREVSYGATNIVPAAETGQIANDGVISVTLPQNHPATDGFTEEIMTQIPGIVRQALEQADGDVDFASFDVNDDGVIGTDELHIATVFAGGEASTGGIYKSIWAHSWEFEPITLDGKELTDYIAAGENFADTKGYPGTTNLTCGVFCHELGHSMGLPDLYDYGYDSEGLGGLSLMASGSWGSPGGLPGKYPVHLDAWSKIALGFVTPIEAVKGTEYLVNDTTRSDYNVLKITNPDNPDQYFLVENRIKNGFDYGLDGFFANQGIVIYHVDEGVMRYAAANPDTFPSFNDNRFRKGIDVEEANQRILGTPELDYYGTNRNGNINPLPQLWRGYTFFAADDPTRYTNYFSDTTIPSAKFYSNPVDDTIIPPLIYDAQTDQEWYFESDATIGAQENPSGVTLEVMDTPLDYMRVRYNIVSYAVTVAASPSTGGTVIGGARVEPGTTLSLQATSNAGYIFTGWSEGDTLVSTDNPLVMPINKNWNLTAEFKPINYTIAFDAYGGTGTMDDIAMTYDVTKRLPASTFTRTGYDFDHWSLTPGGPRYIWDNNTVSNLTTEQGAVVTLYARWKPTPYALTYNLNGGTNSPTNPSTYNITSGDILLQNPTRTGYLFKGWYENSNFTGLPLVVIPAGTLGDRTLYARWDPPILSAVSTNYTSIKISWAGVTDASAYKIYRSTSASGTYSLAYAAPSTSRSFVNTGRVTGQYYYYKVYPVVAGKAIAIDNYKYAKPVPGTTSVTLSKASATSIKVSWSGVSGATRYQVYRATSPNGTYAYQYTVASTARSWINTSLKHGQKYYYKVRAYHLEGIVKVYGNFSAVKSLEV